MSHVTPRFQTPRKLARMCVLGVFLGSVFCAGAHAQTALQPAQVLNLYLKVLINQDIRSATEINDYMRPFNGRNTVDLQAVMDIKNYIMSADGQNKTGHEPPQLSEVIARYVADEQNKTEHERLFFKTLMAAASRSSCQATTSEVERDAATGKQIANVKYVCRIPDARVLTEINAFENNAASDSERADIMSEIVAKLNDAPTEKEISGVLQLEELKADGKSWWLPVSVADLISLVLGNLLSE